MKNITISTTSLLRQLTSNHLKFRIGRAFMRVHGVLIVVLDFFINEIYKSFAGNMIKYCFYFEIKF